MGDVPDVEVEFLPNTEAPARERNRRRAQREGKMSQDTIPFALGEKVN
jgi:hypothetical protein